MKEFKAKLKILKIENLNKSHYGSPSYQLTVQTEDGKILVGKTATNTTFAYEVSWTWKGNWKALVYHLTKSGDYIFDGTTTFGHTKEIDEFYSNLVKKLMEVL